MKLIWALFDDRAGEIDDYLRFLELIEKKVQSGPPKIGDLSVSAQQQKILYATVYLQLYNLVEATVTWCVEEVCDASSRDGRWKPGELTDRLRREWVKSRTQGKFDQSDEMRLNRAVALCDSLVSNSPLSNWSVERGGGGNWDEKEIENITGQLGFNLVISPDVQRDIKRHLRDELGALALVKDRRNRLAHGSISFAECGAEVSVSDLRELMSRTVSYLREVLTGFASYIDGHEFLIPAARPAVGDLG